MYSRIAGCVVVMAMLVAADAPKDSAIAFGAREAVQEISLSPDGTKIAYLAPGAGQGNMLYTVALGSGEPKLAMVADGNPNRIKNCGWVSNDRVICTIYSVVRYVTDNLPFTRLVAVDQNGSNLKLLSQREGDRDYFITLEGGEVVDWLAGEDGQVLLSRDFVPEHRENTRIERKDDGFGVVRVDTRTLSSRKVEDGQLNAIEYISDGAGNVRIMAIKLPRGATRQESETISYSYRARDTRAWKPFARYNELQRSGTRVLAVDPERDVAYATKKEDDRDALYRISLDGSMREEKVFANPQVDIDDVIRLGRRGRVIGASYVTDKRQTYYFDPALQKLAASLSKALPKQPLIRFLGADANETKLLLFAGGDTDPGRYYLYDKQTRKLEELLPQRPQLEPTPLAAVKPITYTASDGTVVPGYLTLPPAGAQRGLPAIVMPHGGPGARDEWGFDWLAQYFANRGYAVLQPNFRGSSGYGDAWFNRNGFQAWRLAIGDVDDAGRWLVKEGIADPSKLAIVGWSYGGYAALQSNVVDPTLFKAAIAIAPVTDLAMLKEESRGWSNFALSRDFIGSGAHIREGSPLQNVQAIKVPVLMFHGELDRNVNVLESKHMAAKMKEAGKPVELVTYPKLDHYLEDSAVRADMLRRSDAFLRKSMGM